MKLGLGTAQFGLDYGISNRRGQCSSAEAAAILRLAAEGGIDVLDTAGAYGTSERVLGQTMSPDHRFRMVSKTPVLSHADVDPRHAVGAALMTTLERLGRDSIYGLLVHHADDLLSAAGAGLWQAMQAIKRRRLVRKIGVSVYDAAQLDQVLDRFDVELVQLPVNLFDQRLVYGGYLARLKARGIEVHARSVFLQGLLLMDPARVPEPLAPVKQPLARLHDDLRTAGLTPLEGALAFVRGLKEIDVVLVGVTCQDELDEILDATKLPPPSGIDFSRFAIADDRFLDPSRWPRHRIDAAVPPASPAVVAP